MGGRGQSKRNYTQEKKTEALEALKTKGLRQVSRELNIPLITLYDWKKDPDKKLGTGRKPVFSAIEERLMVEAMMYASNMGFPQTREDLCDICNSMLIIP